MKIFISLDIGGPGDLLRQQEALQFFKQVQVGVTTAVDVQKGGFSDKGLDDFDAVIIEGGSHVAENGYYLAMALAHKKPVLYLLKKGEIIDAAVDALTRNHDVKKYIRVVFYSPESFLKRIKTFLQFLDHDIGKELFTIKYTLRLSPRLDRYVTWKSERDGKNKADFIRDAMSDIMKGDEEYRQRLE